MAVVKKAGMKTEKVARPTVVLPDEPSEPSDSLSDYSMLLYGAKKIGKTTLCACFPEPLFLATEPGTRALRVRAVDVPDWPTALAAVDALEARLRKDPSYCGTVIADTVDYLYEAAFTWVCKKKCINHPHEENDFGQTWREIRVAFRDLIVRLLRLPCGIVFVSHDVEKEVELADGSKVERVQPTLSGQALAEVEGLVDIIAYYGFSGRKRVLKVRGKQTLVAGNRLREHFVRKGGRPGAPEDRVHEIPLGHTEQEAYNALKAAFDNQQEETGAEEEAPAPKKVVKLKKK